MNFFGIGLPEMALILVLALLVFGPKKLPEIGSSLAKALKSFQKAQQDFEAEFQKEAEQIQKSVTEPMKASIEKPQPKALSAQSADQDEMTSEDSDHAIAEPAADGSETSSEVETSEEALPS
jgi:sec-independent protein translocase protein TatA